MEKIEQKQKHAYWQSLVEEQHASGLSQKEFCKQRDLVLSQFIYFRCQLKERSSRKESGFVPVKVSNKDISATGSSDIKIILPNGFQCILPSNTDCNQIKRLVEALLSC